MIPVIILYVLAVMMTGLYFIVKVHARRRKLADEADFIDLFIDSRRKEIDSLGIFFSITWYIGVLLFAPIICGAITYVFTMHMGFSILVGLFGFSIPELILKLLKHDSRKKFEDRYARSLEQMSTSLRAGMSISQSVEDVARCKFLHESMRKKYAKMSSDLRMGISIRDTFRDFAEGTHSQDAQDVALCIDVQNEVGGHEADVIEQVAGNIHDRVMLRREIKSIFADTNTTVYMMDVLAIGIILGFSILNPTYVEVYFSNPLMTVVFLALLILPVIGSVICHKIINSTKKGV